MSMVEYFLAIVLWSAMGTEAPRIVAGFTTAKACHQAVARERANNPELLTPEAIKVGLDVVCLKIVRDYI
jgi:hypothetical protein